MAYATVTLTGTYQTPDGTPHKGHVEIIPSERVIKDTTGDIILTGRVKVDLDAQGAFTVALPATDDPGLNPTGFGYTIAAKLHSSHPPAVSFSLPASLGATTVEDLTPVDPSTFAPTTTYADASTVTALDTRITNVEDNTTAISAAAFGAAGDGTTDDTAAIQAAINASLTGLTTTTGRVHLPAPSYLISAPLELSSTDTTTVRQAATLIGPTRLILAPGFTGDTAIRHTQTPTQAAAESFGYNCGLVDIEIDGTQHTATTVDGLRLDGVHRPLLQRVYIHNMTGHGWTSPADNSIDAATDDTYASIYPVLIGCKFTDNTGWGIHQTRFSSPFIALGCYVNDNVAGGARITAPNVIWTGGAIAYNEGVGLHLTRSTSAVIDQLSNCRFTSIEIDRNTGQNIWAEHAYNVVFETCRLLTAETGAAFDGGTYISPQMVRLGGTAGMSAFNIKFDRPYVRSAQHTTNPPLTLFDFQPQASDCVVDRMYELAGYSTARVIGNRAGARNFVTSHTGETVFGDSVAMTGAYAEATLTNPTTISTALTDLVFNNETSDATGRYDPATGIYSFREDNGVFLINGYVTVDGAAATSNRLVAVHLRFDSGTGSFSSAKVINTSIAGTGFSQMVPFQFTLAPSTANARIKLATAASTGTALLVGSQYSNLTVTRIA